MYWINRTPSELLENTTPYQKLYKEEPQYNLFHNFGCLAFDSTLTAHRTKFKPCAKYYIFIGYPPSMKAYKLLDLTTREVFVSSDVFHENVFPFINTTHPFVNDPFYLVVLLRVFDHDHETQNQTSQHSLISNSRPVPNDPIPSSIPDLHIPNIPLPKVPYFSQAHSYRTQRIRNKPSYLHDYHFNLTKVNYTFDSSSCRYPLFEFISYDNLGTNCKAYTISLPAQEEPKNYNEAAKSIEWKQAMNDELQAL